MQLWHKSGCRQLASWLIIFCISKFVVHCYYQDDDPMIAIIESPKLIQEPTNKANESLPLAWINIGLILRPDDEQLQGSQLRDQVERRVKEINEQFFVDKSPSSSLSSSQTFESQRIQIRLISTTLIRNPVEMSKIICDKLIGGSGGVVAVIVDTDSRYIDSIASISFTLGLYNIPCIGTTLRDSSLFNKNLHPSYISLTPPYSHQADVWYNLMNELQFRRAFVLTSSEDRDLLARFVQLLEKQNKRLIDDEIRLESIIEYDASSYGSFAQGWKHIVGKINTLLENSMCRVLLVHGRSEEDVRFFLKVIDHLNMTRDGFALILSEETTRVAIEHQLPLPSGIISSKLYSSNGTETTTNTINKDNHSSRKSLISSPEASSSVAEIAYALDALELISRSISDLSSNQTQAFRLLLTVPNSCQSNSGSINDWLKGIELYLSCLRQTFMGQTGFIMFDENDDRLSANYKLLNLANEQLANGEIGQKFRTIGSFTNGLPTNSSAKTKTTTNVVSETETSAKSDHEAKISLDIGSIQWPGGLKGKLISGVFIDSHLRIVTLQEKPFVWVSECPPSSGALMMKPDNDSISAAAILPCTRRDPKTGEDERLCCKGYCMDLLLEISKSLNFTYEVYLVQDNQYGRLELAADEQLEQQSQRNIEQRAAKKGNIMSSLSPSFISQTNFYGGTKTEANINKNKKLTISRPDKNPDESSSSRMTNKGLIWAGIMGELVSRRADMAFAPLTITPRRAQAIDFSKPFKFHGFSILLRRASKHTTLASFLQPFHNQLWILVIGVATHVVALTLYLLDRYSTLGRFGMKRQFIPTRTKSSHDDHPLHLSSSLWFSWSILLNSGVGEHTPKSLSGRVLGIFWSGFAMIVVASYTANLAAFLVLDSREETPTLSGIDDPRLRSGDLAFNFATVKGSAVDSYLQSQVEYINLYRKMEEFNFNNVDESIMALRAGVIDALIWDSTRLEWEVATDDKCSLGIAGELFGSSGYGIGLQKDSYWTKNVTTKLLELHESGFMMELDRRWIAAGKSQPQNSGGGCERRNEDYPETLGIYNIAGVFILFACGLVASFGLIVIERFCYRHRSRLLEYKNNLWRRLGGKTVH